MTRELHGETIILLGDVAVSCASVAVGDSQLLALGATRVFILTMGISQKQYGRIIRELSPEESTFEAIADE